MNNTVIAILLGLGLFGLVSIIVFQDEGPPRMEFKEIVSTKIDERENGDSKTKSTTTKETEAQSKEEATNTPPSVPEETVSEGGAEETLEPIEEKTEETPVPDEETIAEPVVEEEVATTTEEVVEEAVEEAQPAPSDLVAHIKFDETDGVIANDSSGHGNFGTLLNMDTVISWSVGQIDGGLFLDGLNDYVAFSHSETLNLGAPSQSYTIAFWFRSIDDPGAELQIIGKGGRSGPSPFMVRINKNGEPSFRISDGFSATTIQLGNSIVTSSWKYVVAVRDAKTSRLRMYIDGNELGSLVFDTTTKTLQNTSPIYIGRHESASNAFQFYSFSIDNLKIYNRALTTEEIENEFKEGKI